MRMHGRNENVRRGGRFFMTMLIAAIAISHAMIAVAVYLHDKHTTTPWLVICKCPYGDFADLEMSLVSSYAQSTGIILPKFGALHAAMLFISHDQ